MPLLAVVIWMVSVVAFSAGKIVYDKPVSKTPSVTNVNK